MDKYREQLRMDSYSNNPPEHTKPKPLQTHHFPEPSFSTYRPAGSSTMNSGLYKYQQPQPGFNPESQLSYRISGISSMMNSGASKYHQHQSGFNPERGRSYRMPGGSSMMNSGASNAPRLVRAKSESELSYRISGICSMMNSGVSKYHQPQPGFNPERSYRM